MKKSILIIFITYSSILFGQEKSKSELYRADFDFMIEKLIETHPDPYSEFGGVIEFARKKTESYNSINDSMTDKDFTVLMSKFLSNLNDGHTFISSPKNENEVKKYLPLKFKIASDGIFVKNTTKDYINLKGNQLLKINKTPVSEWLKRTKLFEPVENISGEKFGLVKILNNIEQTKKFLGTDKLELTFKNDNKEFLTIISYQDVVEFEPEKTEINFDNDNGLLFWSMLGKDKNIGYIAWDSVLSREYLDDSYKNRPQWTKNDVSWAYQFLKEKPSGNIEEDIKKVPALYEQFYQLLQALKEHKSKNLIIDLRINGGGMTPLIRPVLYMLYGNYFLNFTFDNEMIKKISPLYLKKIGYNDISDFNIKYKTNFKIGDYIFDDFGNFSFNTTLEQRKAIVENGYNGIGAEYIKKCESLENIQIYVLTSPQTFSAAYHFTYFLKMLGRTKIIGVASRQAGNTYMETTHFVLPNTKIGGSISNSKQILFKNNKEIGELLKPDYEMNWIDFKKFRFDKNAEILKALEVIENK